MLIRNKPRETNAWALADIRAIDDREDWPDEVALAMDEGRLTFGGEALVRTNAGWVGVPEDGYLILGADGAELYPCSAADFKKLYQILDEG